MGARRRLRPRPAAARKVAVKTILSTALVAAFAAAAFLPFLGREDHWGSHEERHAEIAREFAVTGDWLVPHLNGRIYYDKPPLLHWLAAGVYALEGAPSLRAARLPSAAAGVVGVLATFGIGLALGSRRAALTGALFLAATPIFAVMARTARPDMLLVTLVLVACWALAWAALRAKTAAAARALALVFGVAAGLATLAKGPLGLALPLAFGALVWWREGRRPLRDGAAAALAAAGFAAAVLAWVVPVYLHPGGPEYIHGVLFQPDLTDPQEKRSALYFLFYCLVYFALRFLPFNLLFAMDAVDALRRRSRAGVALLMVALILAFFTAWPKKRPHYILPAAPFVALAAAEAVERRRARGALWRAGPAALAALGVAGLLAWYGALEPRYTDPNSERAFALRVDEIVPRGAPIASLRGDGEAIAFVGRRDVLDLVTFEGAAEWLTARPGGHLAVGVDDLPEVEKLLGRLLVRVAEVPGHWALVR